MPTAVTLTATTQRPLRDEEMATAEQYGHYVRNRFTVMKLSRVLGLLP